MRLPDARGYELRLLDVGSLSFEAGDVLPDRPVTTCVNALLVRGRGQTLLVDAGSGPADVLWPGAAGLQSALAGEGVEVDEIDAVVLTHLDFDHAGGTLVGTWPDDVRAAFPRLVVSAVALEEVRELQVAGRVLAAYEGEGALELVEDGVEFRPGLRLVSAPGHRQGHCALLVGDEFVFAADVLHHETHIEHPEWDRKFDADPELALETRRTWIERLAESGTPVAFTHIPSRGRVLPGPVWSPDA
jgi:glyoxylase-like metal-dependent hydrolase (beta-lactamase superfamily II)